MLFETNVINTFNIKKNEMKHAFQKLIFKGAQLDT